MSLPLLERLDLSFNSLRSLKSLAAAPLGSIRVLQLCGNSLTRVEGLGSCCRLEVLDLSDNRIRRIDPDAFHGAVDTLRCVIMERNGLRSLSGFPFLPNLEELRIAQNRIPDFTHTECLVQLPKLTRIGFQQNPACQRRQWRSVLAEQLPYLQMIDGEIVSVEDIQRKQPGCISEGIPIGEDHGLPLSEAANDETETPLGTQPALDSQTLQQQQPLLLCYSAKPSKNRSVVQPKAEGPAFGPLPKSKPPPAVPELAALNLGVVGVVAPGISPSSGAGSLLSRRDPPSDTSGLQAIAAQKGTRAGSRYLLKVNRCGTSDDRHTPPHGPGWIKGDLCSASVDRYTRSSSTDVCAIIPSWCPPGASLFSSLPHKESIDFNETRAHRGVDISYLGGPLANSSSANTQLPTMLQGLCLHGDRERGQAKGARCNARLKKHKKATG